ARSQPIVLPPRQAEQQLQPLANVLPQQQVLVQPNEEDLQLDQPMEEKQKLEQVLVQPKEEDLQQQQPGIPVSPPTPEQRNPLFRSVPIVADGISAQRAMRPSKTPKREVCQCDHCDLEKDVDESQKLQHALKKHKDLVYKFMKPELVYNVVPYCDYV
ncbi:hypothetical protein PENTCL1PPCAC_27906, partial [Pristionchus entomophagus]